jgi:ribose transport system permease protein
MWRSIPPLTGWIGVALAVIIAGVGAILGVRQGEPAQLVILYAAGTFALVVWLWTYFAALWQAEPASVGDTPRPNARTAFRSALVRYRGQLIALLLMALAYLVAAATVTGFATWWTFLALVCLGALLIFAVNVSRLFVDNRSAFLGLTLLVALFAVSSFAIDGFASTANLKAMLVFASFLGLACVGPTLVALLGGLDLSVPFVIGAANVGLLYLIGLGVPSWLALIVVVLIGVGVGFVNGLLSLRLQGQSLIVTLGVGFAVSGLIQIITSIGSAYSGNVFGVVPDWLKNIAALNGVTFGLAFPPVIVIWIAIAIFLIWALKNTVYGRNLYALGGNRLSAQRLMIGERRYWIGVYMVSGGFSAVTGAALLGWSGGGFIGVGQPYLFTTLAAVVIGGTSLLGGYGGYGFTLIGVLVLQVLTSFLVGIGLSYEWQQFIFGLLILPMVALYARSPHIRSQI